MLTTEPFDAAPFMTRPEAQAELLDDAFASGSAAYVTHALGIIARAQNMVHAGGSGATSVQRVSEALGGGGELPLTTLLSVMEALGVTLRAHVAPAGQRRNDAA